MTASRREFLLGATVAAAGSPLSPLGRVLAHAQAETTKNSPFLLESSGGLLTSLRFAGDAFPTNYVASGQALGHVDLTWRRPGGPWQQLHSADLSRSEAGNYTIKDDTGEVLTLTTGLQTQGKTLRWTITLRNLSSSSLEIGDLALPLPMHSTFDAKEPPTASVLKHSFVSGHGSYLFWMRKNSVGPYLVMTPELDTHLEYWDHGHGHPSHEATPTKPVHPPAYRAYIHSAAAAEAIQAAQGRWRQPHTSLTLAPNEDKTYAFQFAWARDYAAVRDRIVAADLLDIDVAPGMTIPSDLSVCVALRSSIPIQSLEAEHVGQTTIEPLGQRGGRTLYRITFGRLGENMLLVRQPGGRTTRLEFFATEPVETLFHKRAAFIARHQVNDPTKWYDGLLAEWAMDTHVQLGPDNYDRIKSWRVYEVTCDDPGLSKPAYLASKNAEFPNPAEIQALDLYVEHFVWGGLQRTTDEKYSYGIYGILDWKQNRDSPDPGKKGKLHIWRPYDYSHIVVMYWSLYKIARDYPGIPMKLAKAIYLERAYGTALALFTVPMEVTEWSAYETGFYNEVVIPQLIDELETLGKTTEAQTLRGHWEKKVAFFLKGGADLFGSEYAFDSTGFESTQAITRYALAHPQIAGTTPESAAKFAIIQMQANLFCRGVVEKAYYYYGSDYRGDAGDSFTLSYMSQMGGWAVLDHALNDHALHEQKVPDATIRLGYASYLSSFALMNTGTPASNFGYWFPGAENDGGSGGGFEPAAYGMTWLGQPHHRGPWYYSSESDLGYCGAIRTAATIVADDPIFGRFCFGGELQEHASALHIIPRDGLRKRLFLRTAGQQIDLELQGARFARERSIAWSPHRPELIFQVETEPSSSGLMTLHLEGWPAVRYRIQFDHNFIDFHPEQMKSIQFNIKPGSSAAEVTITNFSPTAETG